MRLKLSAQFFQVELYKEIKKNGSARCLRTALTKFSDLVRKEKNIYRKKKKLAFTVYDVFN
jgi:hypothetical protein